MSFDDDWEKEAEAEGDWEKEAETGGWEEDAEPGWGEGAPVAEEEDKTPASLDEIFDSKTCGFATVKDDTPCWFHKGVVYSNKRWAEIVKDGGVPPKAKGAKRNFMKKKHMTEAPKKEEVEDPDLDLPEDVDGAQREKIKAAFLQEQSDVKLLEGMFGDFADIGDTMPEFETHQGPVAVVSDAPTAGGSEEVDTTLGGVQGLLVAMRLDTDHGRAKLCNALGNVCKEDASITNAIVRDLMVRLVKKLAPAMIVEDLSDLERQVKAQKTAMLKERTKGKKKTYRGKQGFTKMARDDDLTGRMHEEEFEEEIW